LKKAEGDRKNGWTFSISFGRGGRGLGVINSLVSGGGMAGPLWFRHFRKEPRGSGSICLLPLYDGIGGWGDGGDCEKTAWRSWGVGGPGVRVPWLVLHGVSVVVTSYTPRAESLRAGAIFLSRRLCQPPHFSHSEEHSGVGGGSMSLAVPLNTSLTPTIPRGCSRSFLSLITAVPLHLLFLSSPLSDVPTPLGTVLSIFNYAIPPPFVAGLSVPYVRHIGDLVGFLFEASCG